MPRTTLISGINKPLIYQARKQKINKQLISFFLVWIYSYFTVITNNFLPIPHPTWPVIDAYPWLPPVGPIWAKNTPSSGSWHWIGGTYQGFAALGADFGSWTLSGLLLFRLLWPAMGQFHWGIRPNSSWISLLIRLWW